MKQWCVYILMCEGDGTLYTGITNDLPKRIQKHNSGTGAKYTAVRRPVVLVYSIPMPDRSTASKEEYRIKKLSRKEKLDLL